MNKNKRKPSKEKGIHFILYDIILNIFLPDEAYEAHARIDHKFIRLSTPGNKFRNLNDDPALFDFYRDNTWTKHSENKVNIDIPM